MKVLIIGAGDMGDRHAGAYKKINGIHICAVADPDITRCQRLTEIHPIPAYYRDYADALIQEKPDLVSVCVPACLHAEISLASLEQGAFVICEKPIALTLNDAERMVKVSKQLPGRLGIIFQRRYMGVWEEVKHRLPLLGTPLTYHTADFRQIRPKRLMHDKHGNGGPVIDCCVHDFDMTHQLFGKPKQLVATGDIYAQGKPELVEISDLAIDTANILIEFEEGHKAVIAYSWGLPAGTDDWTHTEIIGPKGMIRVFEHSLEHYCGNRRKETISGFSPNGHERQIALCVAAAQAGIPMPVPPEEAILSLQMAYTALASLDSKTPLTWASPRRKVSH